MNDIIAVRNFLTEVFSCVTFDYKGSRCGIDPISRNRFVMWYGTKDATVDSIEKVFNTPIFDGQTLKDIWGDITELDY